MLPILIQGKAYVTQLNRCASLHNTQKGALKRHQELGVMKATQYSTFTHLQNGFALDSADTSILTSSIMLKKKIFI